MAVYVIAFPSSYFFLFLSVTREGVSRGTRGGDTPPTPCFMASQDNGSGGPEKGGGCPRSECAIKHERGHPE